MWNLIRNDFCCNFYLLIFFLDFRNFLKKKSTLSLSTKYNRTRLVFINLIIGKKVKSVFSRNFPNFRSTLQRNRRWKREIWSRSFTYCPFNYVLICESSLYWQNSTVFKNSFKKTWKLRKNLQSFDKFNLWTHAISNATVYLPYIGTQ